MRLRRTANRLSCGTQSDLGTAGAALAAEWAADPHGPRYDAADWHRMV